MIHSPFCRVTIRTSPDIRRLTPDRHALISDLRSGACHDVILGKPGQLRTVTRQGGESAGDLYVPDYQAGTVVVVDPAAARCSPVTASNPPAPISSCWPTMGSSGSATPGPTWRASSKPGRAPSESSTQAATARQETGIREHPPKRQPTSRLPSDHVARWAGTSDREWRGPPTARRRRKGRPRPREPPRRLEQLAVHPLFPPATAPKNKSGPATHHSPAATFEAEAAARSTAAHLAAVDAAHPSSQAVAVLYLLTKPGRRRPARPDLPIPPPGPHTITGWAFSRAAIGTTSTAATPKVPGASAGTYHTVTVDRGPQGQRGLDVPTNQIAAPNDAHRSRRQRGQPSPRHPGARPPAT